MKKVAIIPCHNEEKTVGDMVKRAKEYVDAVWVIDDNSNDSTAITAMIEGAVTIPVMKGHGAGAAVSHGLESSYGIDTPEIFVTLDGDGQHNPDEIPKLLNPLLEGYADVVIGSRFMGDYKIRKYRKLGIDIITKLYNSGVNEKISDAQCCFRAFSRYALQEIMPVRETGFSFSVEMLIKARAKKMRIVEVPVECIYHERFEDNSTLNPVRHGMGVVWGVIKWRVRLEAFDTLKGLPISLLNFMAGKLAGKGLKLGWLRGTYNILSRKLTLEKDRVISINGYLLKVITDSRGLDGTTGTMVTMRGYEPITTQAFKDLLKEGMNVVDVGANIGYYTMLSSKLVGTSGKVWAIEPEPSNLELLQENIALNKMTNITIVDKAVDDKVGAGKFYVSKKESGEHSLVSARSYIKDTIDIETITLDAIVQNDRVDFIKTDTEGNEIAVLKGAENTIKSNKNIIVITEVWCPGIQATKKTPLSLWQLLIGYEFDYFYLLDDIGRGIINGGWFHTYEEAMKRHGGDISVNLLCSRNKLNI